MAQVDLDKICKDFCVKNNRYEPTDILYSHLKLGVVNDKVTWEGTAPKTEYDGPTSVVRVQRANTEQEAYGAVNTLKDNNTTIRVDIIQGGLKNLKGQNSSIRLMLPPKIQKELGKTFEMNVSEKFSESTQFLTVQAQTGQEFPKHATVAEATVKTTDSEYSGRFSCRLEMKGPVIFHPGNKQQQIGEIVMDQQPEGMNVERYPDSSASRVVWDLQGTCKFIWMHNQTIDWK